jgi:hypothetical protein
MKIIQLISFFFISIISYSQSSFDDKAISRNTRKIVDKIEKVNELMSSAVYASGIKPKQWDNFELLEKKATKKELLKLTDHPNGVVRCYSFWALVNKNTTELFPLIKKHLHDDEIVNTQFGCIGGEEKVGDFFIQLISPDEYDLDSGKLNIKELKELDSLLIHNSNNLSSRYWAILRAEPNETLYSKIKELVVKENNTSALIILAQYKKEEDVELIKNFKDKTEDIDDGYIHTYRAISEFPRLEFLPLLEKNLMKTLDKEHFSNEWRELYRTIASYKSKKALELLKVPFTQVQFQNIKKYHIEFVFEAIYEFRDPIYDELLWKIWEEEKIKTIGLEIYNYLMSLNPSKAYELTKREFNENYEIRNSQFIPNLQNIEDSDNYYEYLLNVIKSNDKELYNKIIIEQIKNSNVHDFPLYTSKVKKQNIFIEPLLKRLEKEDNPHIYLNIVETLISYDDVEINNEILNIRKINVSLTDNWGGKALDELLEKNKIIK